MGRKILVVLLGCWALGMSAAVSWAWHELRKVDEYRYQMDQLELLLCRHTQILSVNTVIVQALVQKIQDHSETGKIDPPPGLHLDLEEDQNDK